MQNSKIFLGTIHQTPVLGGEWSLCYFSENVPKRSYNNAEFQKIPELPDPRFWVGKGKLPPLEIMSGYATAEVLGFIIQFIEHWHLTNVYYYYGMKHNKNLFHFDLDEIKNVIFNQQIQ